MINENWQKKVYKKTLYRNKAGSRWIRRKEEIFLRDEYKCQACNSMKNLAPHHIKPRKNGGTIHPNNLITLCEPCHNKIELMPIFKKRSEIKGLFIIVEHNQLQVNPKEQDWHKWVYGAWKNPSQ